MWNSVELLNIFHVSFFQNEKGESEMTSIEFETKQVSHEIGEKLVLPAQPDKGIQVRWETWEGAVLTN